MRLVVAYRIAYHEVLDLDLTLLGPAGGRTRLEEFCRLAFDLGVFFDPLNSNLKKYI